MSPLTEPAAAASIPTGTAVPFMELLGVHGGEHRNGAFHARLAWQPTMANSAGSAHGGVLMSLLDYAMSLAAKGNEAEPPRVMTLDMRTSFLRAIAGDLLVTARCLQRGKTIAFCEASISDDAGALVATASGTFKLKRQERPGDGRSLSHLGDTS